MARRKGSVGRAIAVVGVAGLLALVVSSMFRTGSADGSDETGGAVPSGRAISDQGTPVTHELLGFGKGDAVGRATVDAVFTIIDHGLPIQFQINGEKLMVYVALKGHKPFKPPRETARYSIYFSHSPALATEDRDAVLGAIEARLRQVEATAVVPEGL